MQTTIFSNVYNPVQPCGGFSEVYLYVLSMFYMSAFTLGLF